MTQQPTEQEPPAPLNEHASSAAGTRPDEATPKAEAEATGTAKPNRPAKQPAKPNGGQVEEVINAFGRRPGSYQAKLLTCLAEHQGKPVPTPELMTATYGAAKAKTLKVPGPLAMVIRGLRLASAAKKLPYEIVSSRDEANKVRLLALRKVK